MKFLSTLALLTAVGPALTLARGPPDSSYFTFLFTVTLEVGPPLKPIPTVFGALQIVAPVTRATIAGPALNAAFENPGTVYPVYNKEATLQSTSIVLSGGLEDGTPFLVQENGIGPPEDHWERVVITAGGKYTYLQKEFIIAHTVIISDSTTKVSCWCVGCDAESVQMINAGST